MSEHWFPTSVLAELLGMKQKHVTRRLVRNAIPGRKRAKGKGLEYCLADLPEDWQAIIVEKLGLSIYKEADHVAEAGEMVGGAHPTGEAVAVDCEVVVDGALLRECTLREGEGELEAAMVAEPEDYHPHAWMLEAFAGIEPIEGLPAEQRQYARGLILQLVPAWCHRNRIERVVDCDVAFSAAYRRGEIAVPTWVKNLCGTVSRTTLARWRQLRDQGSATTGEAIGALGGKRGRKVAGYNGYIRQNPDLEKVVWSLLEEQTAAAAGPRTIYRRLVAECPPEICPSYPQVLRYLTWLKTERKAQYLAVASPKDYRNQQRPAVGMLSQDLEPNDVWQIDFTRNDALLRWDGEEGRFALGMIVDVATRRRKVILSPVPKGEATALLLMEAMLDWGMPRRLRPDNGKEFVNDRVMRICATLGIEMDACLPGQPWQKGNVEKALGDLMRQMEVLPGFVGHNVAQRQQIREAKGEEYLFSQAMEYDELRTWLDKTLAKLHDTPHKGRGMDGKTPNQALAAAMARGWSAKRCPLSETELRRLTYSERKKARRDYIVWDTRRYITENLAKLNAGADILICMDGHDLRRIHIYSLDMQTYYGTADWEIHLSKEEMIAAATKAQSVGKAGVAAGKGAAKAGKKIRKEWEKRPDLALSQTAELSAEQRILEGAREEIVAEMGTGDAGALALVASVSQPSPPAPLPGGRGEQEEEEEPNRFKAVWHWFAFHYSRGHHETDPEIRRHMAMELTSTGRDNITGRLNLDADAAYALGLEFGLSTTEADDLREGVLKKERAHKLWAEQRRRFA